MRFSILEGTTSPADCPVIDANGALTWILTRASLTARTLKAPDGEPIAWAEEEAVKIGPLSMPSSSAPKAGIRFANGAFGELCMRVGGGFKYRLWQLSFDGVYHSDVHQSMWSSKVTFTRQMGGDFAQMEWAGGRRIWVVDVADAENALLVMCGLAALESVPLGKGDER